MEAVDAGIVAMWFVAGLALGGTAVSAFHRGKRNKGLNGQVRKMKWLTRRDWFFDPNHEYRLPNLMVMAVSLTLCVAIWLGMFATGLSTLTASALATFLSAIILAAGSLIAFALKEDMG